MKDFVKYNLLKRLKFLWQRKNLKYITILLLLSFTVISLFSLKGFFTIKKKPATEESYSYYFYLPPHRGNSLARIETMMAKELAKINNLEFIKVRPASTKQIIKILNDIEWEDHACTDALVYDVHSFLSNLKFKVLHSHLGFADAKKSTKHKLIYERNKRFVRWLRGVKNYQTKFDKITPYDDAIKRYAKTFGIDWRLIAAQMFAESSYEPNSRSFAGAMGLMQLTPIAMKELGIQHAHPVEDNIRYGIKYLKSRFNLFGRLKDDNRIRFALASYNAGIGHVRDAQRLARKAGINPYKWDNNVESMFLKLQKKEFRRSGIRHGYVRGIETVNYVDKIMSRYNNYKRLVYEE